MDYYRNFDLLEPNRRRGGVSGFQIRPIDETAFIEPVTLSAFKDEAQIDYATDDGFISTFLTAARIGVEQYLQKSLGVKTFRLTAFSIPKRYHLPYGPVASVLTTGYTLVGDILVSPEHQEETDAGITVDYVTDASLVNEAIRTAIYKQAFEYYENRGAYLKGEKQLGQIVNEVKMILQPFKLITFP